MYNLFHRYILSITDLNNVIISFTFSPNSLLLYISLSFWLLRKHFPVVIPWHLLSLSPGMIIFQELGVSFYDFLSFKGLLDTKVFPMALTLYWLTYFVSLCGIHHNMIEYFIMAPPFLIASKASASWIHCWVWVTNIQQGLSKCYWINDWMKKPTSVWIITINIYC